MAHSKNLLKSIAVTTLIAGTFDISVAFLNAYASAKVLPEIVLQYIASGVFGKAAFSGGLAMAAMGLLFHFIIAFASVVAFYLAYPQIALLRKSVLLNAVLIALIAWLITTQFIIPLSQITQPPFDWHKALLAIAILIVFLGTPIALRTRNFYRKNNG